MTSENNGMYMPVVPQGYGNGNDGGMFGGSYADGYSRGYEEAMNQSGHLWPPYYNRY